MHPIYKQVFSVLLCLITIIIACNRCQKIESRNKPQAWTTSLEKQMSDIFYTQAARLTDNERAKRTYAECCLSKMKEMFPKGISNMENEMTDSMKVSIMKMGADCAGLLEHTIKIWEPETKNQLKLRLYSLEEVKLLPPKVKDEYVDCIAFKVTTEFPNGFKENEGKKEFQKFIDKTRTECIKLITRKYENSKSKKEASKIN